MIVRAVVDEEPDLAFARLIDIARYPELTATVHEVHLNQVGDQQQSTWRVAFRGGILCWTEADVIDPVERTMRFEQLDGDVERFDGIWRVEAHDGRCQVIFEAHVDLGIASMAAIVDPVARTTLSEVIRDILMGLFSGVAVHDDRGAVLTAP